MRNKFEDIIYRITSWVFNLFNKNLTDEMFETIMQFIKFGIVGVSNTIISYVIYIGSLSFLNKLSNFKFNYLISSLLSFVLSVLWSFYWNNKYVFLDSNDKKRSLWKTLIKTYISYSFTGLFLNNILLILWVEVLHVSQSIAPLVNLIISVPLNFVINKFWAYKQ